MGRKSRRVLGSRTYHNFSDETLARALEAIQAGQSLRSVSKKFGISLGTLSRKRRGLNNLKYGGQKVLSDEEESQLLEGIKMAGIWGFPLTTYDIKIIVKNYLDKRGIREKRCKNNTPGRRWIERFLMEHKNVLTERNAENVKCSRSEVSEKIIKNYFSELEKSIEGVPPRHIFNYDETNFTDDPGKKRVIVKRGTKHPERCVDSSKASVSVMMAGTADGVLLPPYIVYRSEHMYESRTNCGPKGARYNWSKSGWFDTKIFEDWFHTIVIPFVRTLDEGPKVMIGDNLSSHLSLSVISECEKYNIRFVLLPPNSTHLCQPSNVSFFHPLKVAWRKQLDAWKMKNRGCIPKDQFPSQLRRTLDSLQMASKNLVSGFKACGIYPYDSSEVLKRLPSWVKKAPTEEQTQKMNSSFIELLENMRYPGTNKTNTRKRKYMDVVPGRSVMGSDLSIQENPRSNNVSDTIHENTVEDENSISQELEPDLIQASTSGLQRAPQKTRNTKKEKKKCNSDSDDSDDDFSIHDSSSDYGTLEDLIRHEAPSPAQEHHLPGEFLLVEFRAMGKKREKSNYYVGQIIEIIETGVEVQYYCKFMRNTSRPKTPENTFVFPSVDDCSIIDNSMVIMKLNPPLISRGYHTFDIEDKEQYYLR